MSRLLSLGVISQAIDPAAKMATDYCNFVIAQGGEVNYATAYSIYKNDVLTDPDWQKLALYCDGRAGKVPTPGYPGTYLGIYSLIPPYNLAACTAVSQRFTVTAEGKIQRASTNTPILYFNTGFLTQEGVCKLKTVEKIDFVAGANVNLPTLVVNGMDSNGAYASFFWTRYLYGTKRFASYINHYEAGTTTNNFPTIAYTEDIPGMIIARTIDYESRLHTFIVNGNTTVTTIATGRTPRIMDDTTAGRSLWYEYAWTQPYSLKIYKL
jgi:hypothetical protein